MKELELRDLAECCSCHKKIGELPLPIFHKVTIERHGLDLAAVQRQQGLGMMIGGPLAMHMGPDEDMTKLLSGPVTAMVCDECLLSGLPMLFSQYEQENDNER